MIDYKLILILILSIVLLYIYNKTETLKNDFKKLNINFNNKFNDLENKLALNNTTFCKMPTYDKIFNTEEKKTESNDQNNIKDKEIENFDINTLDFTATENMSESEDIHLTTSENIVIYSNDENKNIINVENIIENLANENVIQNLTSENITLDNPIPNIVEVINLNNLKNINSDLDYEDSDKNIDIIDLTNSLNDEIKLNDNFNNITEERNSLNLDIKSKLIEIQNYAKSLNIDINKNTNDKIKNKTKKELLDEINKLNLINHK